MLAEKKIFHWQLNINKSHKKQMHFNSNTNKKDVQAKSYLELESSYLRHVTVLVYSSQKKSPFSVVSEKSTNKTWKRKQVVDNVFKEPLYNNHIG